MTLELFPFRYRDARTGEWVHARYRATVEEIEQRYKVWRSPARQTSESARP